MQKIWQTIAPLSVAVVEAAASGTFDAALNLSYPEGGGLFPVFGGVSANALHAVREGSGLRRFFEALALPMLQQCEAVYHQCIAEHVHELALMAFRMCTPQPHRIIERAVD